MGKTMQTMGMQSIAGLFVEIFDVAVDYLYAVDLITHKSADVNNLGWISLLCAIIGVILFGIKMLLTKKFLGHQVVELKKRVNKINTTIHETQPNGSSQTEKI